MLITVLRVSRSCELFPGGFDLHLLRQVMDLVPRGAECEEVGERFRKSTPSQRCQLIAYYYQLKYQVDIFVGELTFKN